MFAQRNLSDLTGIQGFTSLKHLNAWSNNLTSVDVSINTALEYISLYDNQLTSIDITKNTKLKTFGIEENQLTIIDVSQNIELTNLSLGLNQLTTIDLSKNIKLKDVRCELNNITALDVTNLTALEFLKVSENKITVLNLSENLKIITLIADENELEAIDLSKNTALEDVALNDNKLTELNIKNGNNTSISSFDSSRNFDLLCIKVDDADYSLNNSGWSKHIDSTYLETCGEGTSIPDENFEIYLEFKGLGNGINNDGFVDTDKISGLKVLDISDENITDLTGIEDFTSLTTLDASLNSITNVDLSKNINLETLNIAQNPTTTLNISQNIKLTSLNVSGNQLTTFDVSKNTELKVLDVKLNQLTTIDLSKNIAITELNIGSNNLASLDLSKNINLERLDAAYSQLSSIEINNNKKLYYADLSGNELENLNMYDNITLGRLRINNNKLKYLDIQNNINLVELNASNNELLGLKLQNTKNSILFNIDLRVNPNLTCVEVDDTSFSNNNWPNKDTQTIYSLDCLPVNDDCDKALPLTFGQQTPGDVKNGNATNNAPCVVGTVLADVWFSVFVPQSGEFSIEGSGFGGQLKFAVYESCASLAPVACGANISLKGLTAGKKFYLKVWLETASSTSAKNQSENGTFVLKAEATSVLSVGDFINEENKISVYPNPATSNVTISSDFLIQKVELFNLFGKRIVFDRPNKPNSVVDVSGLSTGVYIVKIRSNNLSILKKLIVN